MIGTATQQEKDWVADQRLHFARSERTIAAKLDAIGGLAGAAVLAGRNEAPGVGSVHLDPAFRRDRVEFGDGIEVAREIRASRDEPDTIAGKRGACCD